MNENKNLILAISLSMLVLIAWPFINAAINPPPPPPSAQPQSGQNQSGQNQAGQLQSGQQQTQQGLAGDGAGVPGISESVGAPDSGGISEQQALAEAPRIKIDTPRLHGSINLQGARFDNLTLADYRQTLEDESPEIELLLPSGSETPYFVQYGWSAADGLAVPDSNTLWSADSDVLSPGVPVTLSWTSPENVTFQQVLTIDENYMIAVSQRVVNGSAGEITIAPFSRVYRAGLPETVNFYILHEGLIGVFDGVLEEWDYSDLEDEPGRRTEFLTEGGWMGITDKYWLVALIPNQASNVKSTFLQTGVVQPQFHVNYLLDTQTIAPDGQNTYDSHFFAGAKETNLLDQYSDTLGVANFDLAVDFGWFYFLTKPFFYALDFLNNLLGNFGLAILAFTVVIKIIFFPLANKSYKSMSKMKLLQPKLVEMRERLGDDKMKMQQEMMALYKKEQVNPLSGCLPILVQIPVFFALYKVLFVAIEMRHAPFFGWIEDLSAPDPLGLLTLFGLIPWDVPGILQLVNIGIWPIIMGFTMWFQQKLNPPPADPIQARIFAIMPFMFTFLLGGFAAGLVIYWAWNNALSILQQYIIMRRMGVAIGGGKIEDQNKSS